jgi:hypothetical protein
MLNESLLWSRTFSPTGRQVKEPTVLGIALGAIAVAAILFFALPFVFSFL